MRLRLPSSGFLLESLITRLAASPTDAEGGTMVDTRRAAGASIVEVRGGVDAASMRATMLAYGGGDRDWRGTLAWTPR